MFLSMDLLSIYEHVDDGAEPFYARKATASWAGPQEIRPILALGPDSLPSEANVTRQTSGPSQVAPPSLLGEQHPEAA